MLIKFGPLGINSNGDGYLKQAYYANSLRQQLELCHEFLGAGEVLTEAHATVKHMREMGFTKGRNQVNVYDFDRMLGCEVTFANSSRTS